MLISGGGGTPISYLKYRSKQDKRNDMPRLAYPASQIYNWGAANIVVEDGSLIKAVAELSGKFKRRSLRQAAALK